MVHRNTSMDTRFRQYMNQNFQNNNPRNRHRNLRSNARRSNYHPSVHRDFPPVMAGQWQQQQQQHHQPYFRNSWMRRPFSDQQHGGRYNLRRNPRLNRYAHGRNIIAHDHPGLPNYSTSQFPVLQPGLPNYTPQFLNAHDHGIPPDQRQLCTCCQNVVNGYGETSNNDQELGTNHGRESNEIEEDELAGQENQIQGENQRQVNIVLLHIDLHLEYPSTPADEEDEDQNQERPENEALTEQTILQYLPTKIHGQSGKQEEPEICVVCQSDFEREEVVGYLDCGHEYHVECITKWLLRKNFCPVCKSTALPAAGDV